MSKSRDYYHPQLKCFVTFIGYDFETKQGMVRMPEGCCVDMPGTTRLFESIDPAVTTILTVAGVDPDTRYKKGPAGWEAFAPPRRVGGKAP